MFSFGIQYGKLQRKIDDKKLILESDYNDPGGQLADRPGLTGYKAHISDLNFGINYKTKITKTNIFNIGISVFHLLKPVYKGIRTDNYINRRYTFHTNLQFSINNRIKFKPQAIVSISDNAYNIMLQLKTFMKFNNSKNNNDMVFAGLGYRVNDAIQMMFGIRYKKMDIGIAYDITVSSAAQYNDRRGGVEIGIYKIINIPRKIKTVPVLFCPEL